MIHTTVYRFTKGLTQNVNLRTHLKLEYNIKSLYFDFYFVYMISDFKVIKLGNDCVTLHFE